MRRKSTAPDLEIAKLAGNLVKGYRVLRVSYDWLATDPRGVAETIWAQCQMSGSIASSE